MTGMNERETHIQSDSERKARIRDRYKGIDREELEVIPAIKEVSLQEDTSVKRVGGYARVSTDDPNQTSSYELQKNHFEDEVERHPGWVLVDVYADEGISGTSLNHRDNFNRMIADCEAGKLDLIITKSVSRFARNVLDCIGQVRKLAALPHPVGVLFETENLYTLNRNSEMALSFISTLAQEESHNKSDIMNASIYGEDGNPLPTDEATRLRNEAVYEIGNMTLLSSKLNKELQNYCFSDKVNGALIGRKQRFGMKTYASLSITKEVINRDPLVWNEDSIHERTYLLTEEVKQIWKV